MFLMFTGQESWLKIQNLHFQSDTRALVFQKLLQSIKTKNQNTKMALKHCSEFQQGFHMMCAGVNSTNIPVSLSIISPCWHWPFWPLNVPLCILLNTSTLGESFYHSLCPLGFFFPVKQGLKVRGGFFPPFPHYQGGSSPYVTLAPF